MSRLSRRGFLARTLYGIAVGSASACTVKQVVPRPGLPDYTETIGNTGVTFDMKGIPAGEGIPEFWLGRTEVTWDAFLLWAYEESQTPAGTRGADGVTHPTKPYGDVYRGYGRGTGNKQPALGMTHKAAVEYCVWLSRQTGKTYRLPTEAEWEHAFRAGQRGTVRMDGWHRGNSGARPRDGAAKEPNAYGLYDMAGNVAEWCAAPPDGKPPAVRGGHFLGGAELLRSDSRLENNPEAWNAYDPQEPKSVWWLSSADFVGFRVARSPAREK